MISQNAGNERVPFALSAFGLNQRLVADCTDKINIVFFKILLASAAWHVFLNVLNEMLKFVNVHGVFKYSVVI